VLVTQLFGMGFLVVEDVLANPIGIGSFSVWAVMPTTNLVPQLLQ
jgi:hypothetical protein